MSLPFYTINCTGCSFTSCCAHDVTFEFEGGRNAEFLPHLSWGWCNDCQKVNVIFIPQTQKTIADGVSECEEWVSGLNESKSKRRFFFFKTKINEEFLAYWEKRLAQLNRSVKYYEQHCYPARCLTCGNINVMQVGLPAEFDDEGKRLKTQNVPLGIKHSCGGEIQASLAGRANFAQCPKVVYDIAGNILVDERSK